MITSNEIFTKLHNELNNGERSIFCTTTHDPLAPDLPCLYYRETHFRPSDHITLGYDDEVIDSTVYIELYDTEDLQDLVYEVESVMNSMYYVETSCIQVDNADVSIERYSLTFNRIICGGDSLEEGEIDNG